MNPTPPLSSPRRIRLPGGTAGVLVLLLIPMLESGCVAALGAGSIALTDKTPLDHVYSAATGKTCAIGRSPRA